MKTKNAIKRTLLSVTLVLGLFSGGLAWLPEASAADIRDKWYLGFGLGRTFGVSHDNAGFTFTESDQTYKLLFGYHLFKHLAIEGGITQFNKINGNFTGTVLLGSTPYTGSFRSWNELTGIEVSVVWHIPFWNSDTRQATFFLKGGTFTWDDENRLEITSTLHGVADSSGTDITAGFGVQIRGEGNAAIRFEVQRYETDVMEIDTIMINFIYYH